MVSVLRSGVSKIFNTPTIKTLVSRSITGKALRLANTRSQKPEPYPYNTKKYGMFQRLFDRTVDRLDENSKIIVVEGPVASGKSAFAKELADELDMLYMPEANYDMVYINSYGYDLRELDKDLPESCRSFDVKDFCLNPCHSRAASFQITMYTIRYSQYIDALAHMLSTGQGVVLDRCAFSDFVFLEAMFNSGYVSKGARSVYYDVKENTISELMRPHLVIYLDVPVKKVQENIKKRGIPYEVNSKVFSNAYLEHMDTTYKQHYLKEMNIHSELLIYDWSEPGEVEVVVEDIERIDFDHYEKGSKKLLEWRLLDKEDWDIARNLYADKKFELISYLNIPRYDVPELLVDGNDMFVFRELWNNAPGQKFEKGYNKEMGDSSFLFKMDTEKRQTLPLRERRVNISK